MADQQPQAGAWQGRGGGWSGGRVPGQIGAAVPGRERPGHSGQLNPGGEEWAQYPAGVADGGEPA